MCMYVFLPMTVDDMIIKERKKLQDTKKAKKQVETGLSESAVNFIAEQDRLDLPHVNFFLEFLTTKKLQLEQVCFKVQLTLVHPSSRATWSILMFELTVLCFAS